MVTATSDEIASKKKLKDSDEKIAKAEKKAEKAEEKAEKNAAKMAALQIKFDRKSKNQKTAAGTLSISENAKDLKEAQQKILIFKEKMGKDTSTTSTTTTTTSGTKGMFTPGQVQKQVEKSVKVAMKTTKVTTVSSQYSSDEKGAKEKAQKLQQRADQLSAAAAKAQAHQLVWQQKMTHRIQETHKMETYSAEMKAQELTEKANELSAKEKHAKVDKHKTAKRVEQAKQFQTQVIDWGKKHFGDTAESQNNKEGKGEDALDDAADASLLLGQPARGHRQEQRL